ncbi:DHA2 family efflux MFS transporter permease subunit [Methylobacterium sp. PvR107]|uniref:DHA2 family efflux MFS transporter permease subunit n=1 Tax=Methylobacterium sp. PvR107 TaxID=2806597 RepID=UPI001B637F3E|nr:DHA2 family efflux MFS transporter permease subunit [Methylobacterium sp. PvR107]MBP1178139.1 DHA2 family multidrug resistance protein [Methylobacterium sp. PvR107]
MTPHPVGAVRPRMPDIRQAARASVPIVHDVADAADRPAPTNPIEAISPAPTAGPRTWAGFAILCVGMFIAILDIQIVATSLPRIQAGLGIAPDRISWVQTAYLTAELLVIPLTGPLTRLASLRRLFVTSVTLFTLASCGCAASGGFASLIVWRALQGASGGALIPTVFSAVFLLFPPNRQGIATAVAGTLAVLAPTAGPVVGGWITETASWHWLFLINVLPGIVSAIGGYWLLSSRDRRRGRLSELDVPALVLLAVALGNLELGLKAAPESGWTAPATVAHLGASTVSALVFVRRTLTAAHPLVELRMFADRRFAVGSALSFACGVGLYGCVYLMPVFLGYVQGRGPLAIGEIMLVTGLAQLAASPLAVALDGRVDATVLAVLGFGLFAVGSFLSTTQTAAMDPGALVVPQVVRGLSIMFCLLAPTRLALGQLAAERVPDASGLFNLMRNLGGAVGLSLIDTVIYGRIPGHVSDLVARLASGDVDAARGVGIPPAVFAARSGKPISEATRALVAPLVEKAALTASIGDAWMLVGTLNVVAIAALLLVRRRADPSLEPKP